MSLEYEPSLEQAMFCAKVVSYAQGFMMMQVKPFSSSSVLLSSLELSDAKVYEPHTPLSARLPPTPPPSPRIPPTFPLS